MQREKGKRFERFIADELRKILPAATIHRTIQAHAAFQADVTIEGDCPAIARNAWLELTDSRKPNVTEKLAQAERDAAAAGPDRLPLVVWKKTGSRSVYASMRLRVLGRLLGFRAGTGEEEMVTVGWPVVIEAFRRAADVRAKMGQIAAATPYEAEEGIRTDAPAAACKAPPRPVKNTDLGPPVGRKSAPHVSNLVPSLTYVDAPAGFPSQLIMSGARWDVKYASDLLGNQSAYGCTFPVANLIVLDVTMAAERMRQVLLHELLHAAFSMVPIRLMSDDEEEDAVRALTIGLHSVLPRDWWNK